MKMVGSGSGIPVYQTMTDERFNELYNQAWDSYFDLLNDYKNAIVDGDMKKARQCKSMAYYVNGNVHYACEEMISRRLENVRSV